MRPIFLFLLLITSSLIIGCNDLSESDTLSMYVTLKWSKQLKPFEDNELIICADSIFGDSDGFGITITDEGCGVTSHTYKFETGRCFDTDMVLNGKDESVLVGTKIKHFDNSWKVSLDGEVKEYVHLNVVKNCLDKGLKAYIKEKTKEKDKIQSVRHSW